MFERERHLLATMAEIADASRHLPDGRVVKLKKWIEDNMCSGGKWNNTRVIIFTEWEDTLRYLREQLTAAIEGTNLADDRIEVYQGPTSRQDREAIKAAFNEDPSKNPVRILIATDAAREGLNLQAHCWNLFHFDVPWNPSRMEQRNGRIDRKLQPNPVVFCHYFRYEQRPEDRILAVLVRKTQTIRAELGSLAQVIDSRLESMLKSGIRRSEIDNLAQQMESADLETGMRDTVAEELESSRDRQMDLRLQVDRLRNLLDASKKAVGLKEEHFRAAVSCSLEIMKAAPLKAQQSTEAGPERYVFPAIVEGSWAETMDALRRPRKREESFYEWRRDAAIRPVVFEDPGIVTDEVVQLHLEQRVVQRLLGRFTAQGFVHHDLSRACLAHSSDAIPRVLLVGRLALYGPGAARLHEELVTITARWIDPMIRKGALTPYGREAETRTMTLLDEALLNGHGRPLPEVTVKQLQQSAPRDVEELLPHLEKRCAEYADEAIGKLIQRGEKEAADMRKILETQRDHIVKKVADHESVQMQLQLPGMKADERRQLDADRRRWSKRLSDLPRELEEEPARIRGVYEVRARRVEPVGLVYLWPVTG